LGKRVPKTKDLSAQSLSFKSRFPNHVFLYQLCFGL